MEGGDGTFILELFFVGLRTSTFLLKGLDES